MAAHRDQIDRVRRDALFANCAPLQLARVLGKLEPVTFAAGQDLYSRGAKADALYLLDGGDVERITESGRRTGIAVAAVRVRSRYRPEPISRPLLPARRCRPCACRAKP